MIRSFKSKLFTFSVAINDDLLAAMKRFPDLAEKALLDGANYWHTGILPSHFQQSAHEKYGYVRRTMKYLRQKHGKPDLISSGSMRQDLKAQAIFKIGASGGNLSVELRMWARTLNFVPNMPQDSDALRVHQKQGKRGRPTIGYPNLKREIKAVTEEDREAVAKVIVGQLEKVFGDTQGSESDD